MNSGVYWLATHHVDDVPVWLSAGLIMLLIANFVWAFAYARRGDGTK